MQIIKFLDQSRTSVICATISDFPPLGLTRVLPQIMHCTLEAAWSKIICSLPQSMHLTFKKLLLGLL